jgi:hypothetical protein
VFDWFLKLITRNVRLCLQINKIIYYPFGSSRNQPKIQSEFDKIYKKVLKISSCK